MLISLGIYKNKLSTFTYFIKNNILYSIVKEQKFKLKNYLLLFLLLI